MGGMKLSELDFLRLLPVFMREDAASIAISKAIDKLIGEPCKRLSTIRTWDKIDELNEAECDELAWELDIDWYNSAEMTLEEKRATIKAAQQIKRKRGTKWAVERVISTYLGEGYVVEWDELDGAPFTFAVLTTNTHITADYYEKFVEAANAAKNERSHITGVFYFWQQGPDPGIECALGSNLHRYNFEECGTIDRPATIGFVVRNSAETEPEEQLMLYSFTAAGEYECGADGYKATVGAAIVGTAKVGTAIVTE